MIAILLVPLFAVHSGVFLWRAIRHHRLRDALLVATFFLLTTAYTLVATNTIITVDVGIYTVRLRDLLRGLALLTSLSAIFLFVKAKLAKRR